MRYRIDQIKLSLEESESSLEGKIREKLGPKGRKADIENVEILRKSIDARGNEALWVYSLAFDVDVKLKLPAYKREKYSVPKVSGLDRGAEERPVVVGFGPCGMFCALVLAEAGLRPLVLERGGDVDERSRAVEEFWKTGKLNPESNVQFGEGGAGTFSDGKLNTGIRDHRVRFVLETMVEAGAGEDVLIDARPHVGTDVLKTVVKNIRSRIALLGGEVRFHSRVDNLILESQDDRIRIRGVNYTDLKTGESREMMSFRVVLAPGHSARDTVRTLFGQGLMMEQKPFSMGVRVEHDQEVIDKGIYGGSAGNPKLPPAYYKLSYRAGDGRGVYSFCMCPGGEIVNAASREGGVVTNGMSSSRRNSGRANSGILVDVRTDDFPERNDPLSGMDLQEEYERLAFRNGGGNYSLPETTWGDFSDAAAGGTANPVVDSLPAFVAMDIAEAMPFFGRRIEGFDARDVKMVGIESRSSSPVRMVRSPERLLARSAAGEEIEGLYPGGEGAGYAGGIASAACDGIKIAEKILEDFLGEMEI